MQDEIDQVNLQNDRLNALIGQQKEEPKAKDAGRTKESRPISSSQEPAKTEMFDISEEAQTDGNEAEQEEADDDAEWQEHPGWEWDPNVKKYVKTTSGRFQDLDYEECFQFATHNEAHGVNFDDWPGPGRVLMYTRDVRETVQLASITPEKASIWIGKAESTEIKCWRDLSPDSIYLKKLRPKSGKGFIKSVVQRPELKTRVEMIKIELSETHSMLSGQAL